MGKEQKFQNKIYIFYVKLKNVRVILLRSFLSRARDCKNLILSSNFDRIKLKNFDCILRGKGKKCVSIILIWYLSLGNLLVDLYRRGVVFNR